MLVIAHSMSMPSMALVSVLIRTLSCPELLSQPLPLRSACLICWGNKLHMASLALTWRIPELPVKGLAAQAKAIQDKPILLY